MFPARSVNFFTVWALFEGPFKQNFSKKIWMVGHTVRFLRVMVDIRAAFVSDGDEPQIWTKWWLVIFSRPPPFVHLCGFRAELANIRKLSQYQYQYFWRHPYQYQYQYQYFWQPLINININTNIFKVPLAISISIPISPKKAISISISISISKESKCPLCLILSIAVIYSNHNVFNEHWNNPWHGPVNQADSKYNNFQGCLSLQQMFADKWCGTYCQVIANIISFDVSHLMYHSCLQKRYC